MMPTYTAISLDRLMEPEVTKPAAMKIGNDPRLHRWSSANSVVDRTDSSPSSKLERGVSVPNPKRNGKNSTLTGTSDRKRDWTIISPALYATPESTPLPDSPSSFPPSPYIVNHKRRGPRLIKTFSEADVALCDRPQGGNNLDKVTENELKCSSPKTNGTSAIPMIAESPRDDGTTPPALRPVKEELVNGASVGKLGKRDLANGLSAQSVAQNAAMKSVTFSLQGDEADDFFDPQDPMSAKSNAESESSNGAERSVNVATPTTEFYDAWEELSSECTSQPSVPDVEAELREIRTSLLMEIEKRKQAEEALCNMQVRWQKIRDQFVSMGLTLPCNLAEFQDDNENSPAEELSRQLCLARVVSNSIGKGAAKAEIEMEMEAQIDLKNFEIARLMDRLHYYEAVSREMSQRNQETIEAARRLRQKRKRIHRWVWGSIAGAITIGAAAVAWSYFPSGKGSASPSQSHSQSPQGENALNQ